MTAQRAVFPIKDFVDNFTLVNRIISPTIILAKNRSRTKKINKIFDALIFKDN
jgi:hypothetical protein